MPESGGNWQLIVGAAGPRDKLHRNGTSVGNYAQSRNHAQSWSVLVIMHTQLHNPKPEPKHKPEPTPKPKPSLTFSLGNIQQTI